ncbi:hypothetical protein [Tumebacillus permanentifrigoris]|uniref:Uncharacterized protein n=1 Tax=Tumebacillus permanentifrigoris TaxID=378543 RepID=A0A316DFM3_9BACL|nr:hypothetical protein [Tumebacillus permanentifrigoris]PWK16352.1 hypothetical protein C7459_101216 [Tumebacillus permanentifrigoris]
MFNRLSEAWLIFYKRLRMRVPDFSNVTEVGSVKPNIMRIIKIFLRYCLFLIGSVLAMLLYQLWLLHLGFFTLISSVPNSGTAQRLDQYFYYMFYSCLPIGFLLATRGKIVRIIAVLGIFVIYVAPVLIWYWNGAPS